MNKRNWLKAEESFSSAISAFPLSEASYAGAAEVYMKEGRREEALNMLQKGIVAMPGSVLLKQTLERADKN